MQNYCFSRFGTQLLPCFCDCSHELQDRVVLQQYQYIASPPTNFCHFLYSGICAISSSNLSMSSSEPSLFLYQTLSFMYYSHILLLKPRRRQILHATAIICPNISMVCLSKSVRVTLPCVILVPRPEY